MRLYHGSKGGLVGSIAPLDVLLDVYPGMHALSPEMAIKDLKGCNHGHVVADGPTEEALRL